MRCHPGWNVCDETNVSTPELKIRAECGNPACSDLCGGPEATPVPTATDEPAYLAFQPVPEPSAFGLLAIGASALLVHHRRHCTTAPLRKR